ncbi:hypothetical protein WJX72_002604 [[Myrmecia] bisecta]|uniref:Uncharacterized protein n=1 Tax=[Myrmecia] bisecta TaxID=41462 RepID=A0AAW1PNH0_9CHLO
MTSVHAVTSALVLLATVAGLGVSANQAVFIGTRPDLTAVPPILYGEYVGNDKTNPLTLTNEGFAMLRVADAQYESVPSTSTLDSPFAAPENGLITFSSSMEVYRIGNGWSSGPWGEFDQYQGTIFFHNGDVTITFPAGITAVSFLAEGNYYGQNNIEVGWDNGDRTLHGIANQLTDTHESGGGNNANYFGFYHTGGCSIKTITVRVTNGPGNSFALGNMFVSQTMLGMDDPVFQGLNGVGPYVFHGIPNAVHNLISEATLQVNARFVAESLPDLDHGTWMSQVGLLYAGHQISLEAVDFQHLAVKVDGKPAGAGMRDLGSGGRLTWDYRNKCVFESPRFLVTVTAARQAIIESEDQSIPQQTVPSIDIQVSIKQGGLSMSGVIGQTADFSGDEDAEAFGQLLEATAEDYVTTIFGTDCKYNKYIGPSDRF